MARPVKDRKPGSLDPNLYAPWWTRPGYKPPAKRPPDQGPRPAPQRPIKLPEGHGYRKDPRTIDPKRDGIVKQLRDGFRDSSAANKFGETIRTLLEETPMVSMGSRLDSVMQKIQTPTEPYPLGFADTCGLVMPQTYYTPNYWNQGLKYDLSKDTCGPLAGQAISGGVNALPATIPRNRRHVTVWYRGKTGSVERCAWQRRWSRPNPLPLATLQWVTTKPGWANSPGILQNPNLTRTMPGSAPSPNPTTNPTPTQAPATGNPVQIIIQSSGAPRLPTGQPFATRSPPGPGKKEGKTLSGNAKLGITLYKILDQISEGCEVVDAFFSALPGNTQIRWSRDRDGRLADNAGQYGLGGCDWKLQALYHNWHQVNFDTAVRNMIANQLQDRVIGDIQKILPKNTGQALEGGEMTLNQILDAIFKGSGLTQ